MHVFAIVITPGTRRTAVRKAFEILAKPRSAQHDYAGVGGRFADRLHRVMDTEMGRAQRVKRASDLDAWSERIEARRDARRLERIRRSEQRDGSVVQEPYVSIPVDPEDVEGLIDVLGEMDDLMDDPRPPEVVRDEDCVALISDLPRPLPEALVPPLVVTPDGRWHWRPLEGPGLSGWPDEVNRVIGRYRGRHCVVVMDVHV